MLAARGFEVASCSGYDCSKCALRQLPTARPQSIKLSAGAVVGSITNQIGLMGIPLHACTS